MPHGALNNHVHRSLHRLHACTSVSDQLRSSYCCVCSALRSGECRERAHAITYTALLRFLERRSEMEAPCSPSQCLSEWSTRAIDPDPDVDTVWPLRHDVSHPACFWFAASCPAETVALCPIHDDAVLSCASCWRADLRRVSCRCLWDAVRRAPARHCRRRGLRYADRWLSRWRGGVVDDQSSRLPRRKDSRSPFPHSSFTITSLDSRPGRVPKEEGLVFASPRGRLFLFVFASPGNPSPTARLSKLAVWTRARAVLDSD